MYVTLANDEIPLDLLTRIAEGEMDAYFHNTILDRAESYYDERYWTLGAVGGGNLHATVRGTRVYSVQLKVDMSGLSLDCSCPYEGECKHLAAFVWLITEEWRDELKRALISDAPAEEAFTQHLNTLSKDALKDLVKQFAPTEFRQSILLRAAPADTVEHELQVVLGRVARLFGYREYYETPGDYEDELEARLKELEPFMALRGRAVLDTLRNIWIDINERMGRGELYDDYNDGPFENGALVYFAARLVYAQPEGARADYLRELRSMRQEIEEYDTFGGLIGALLEEAPDDRALQHLAPMLMEPETLVLADHRERRALLDRLRPLLDEVQEKQLLEALVNKQDHYFSVAMARLLERQEGAEAGRKFLKQALRGDTSYSWEVSTAFQCLVELTASARGKSAERKVLLDYLQRAVSAEALRFAITRRPELAEEFTQLVEERQPSFLLYYFIEEDAHTRAIDLLDRHEFLWNDKRTYDLLLSYATTYPDHARKLVYQMLDEHLPQAHRRAYAEVVRALQLLRAAGPVEELLQVVSDIKATYRRRSLLMGMVGGM